MQSGIEHSIKIVNLRKWQVNQKGFQRWCWLPTETTMVIWRETGLPKWLSISYPLRPWEKPLSFTILKTITILETKGNQGCVVAHHGRAVITKWGVCLWAEEVLFKGNSIPLSSSPASLPTNLPIFILKYGPETERKGQRAERLRTSSDPLW